MEDKPNLDDIKSLFIPSAATPKSISLMNQRTAGFVIPEYQRPYDWSEENIDRLFSDILTGFARLNEASKSTNVASGFAFLGSVILVESEPHDRDFEGFSYSVIDGQQRLTTLALFACALSVALRKLKSALSGEIVADDNLLKWLIREIDHRTKELDGCVFGKQIVDTGKTYPFPRIIRSGGSEKDDSRGSSIRTAQYFSSIARVLNEYSKYVAEDDKDNPGKNFVFPELRESSETIKLTSNYKIIQKLVDCINEPDWYMERDFDQLEISSIDKTRYRNLFSKLGEDQDKINVVLRDVKRIKLIEPLIRTLLFSSYFCRHIVLTLVITKSESAAFDIFDSLNTTGQPLTALETLRPRVVTYEKEKGDIRSYAGSESEQAFIKIANHLDEQYPDTSKKQLITKELIVSFRLYLDGKRLPKDLSSQRQFLSTSYDHAIKNGKSKAHKGMSKAHVFVNEIANLSEFRYHYFDNRGISNEQQKFHTSKKNKEHVQILSAFIFSMKTTISIPILFRYWNFTRGKLDEGQFIEVLRAIVAFILLRRAATGTTANIEHDFRSLMAVESSSRTGIKGGNCIGLAFDNEASSISELKTDLLTCLKNSITSDFTKENWVSRVVENPLYRQSRDLVRFMILVAADGANPSANGTWSKSEARSPGSSEFLNYETLTGTLYKSVEHIAPDSKNSDGWDDTLYEDDLVRHKLGNLILLPTKENASIGKQSWAKKRIFYKAATAKDQPELQQWLVEAKNNSVVLPKSTEKLLQNGNRLKLLKPLKDLETWDRYIVEERSKNIAELCWDFVRPWLD